MENLINGYITGSKLAEKRIGELTALRNTLRKNGETAKIQELGLDRRIELLYTEKYQMMEIIRHLSSFRRKDISA